MRIKANKIRNISGLSTGVTLDKIPGGFSLISYTGATSPDANTVSTSEIDTTGANLFVVIASSYQFADAPILTDNKGNIWNALTLYQFGGNIQMFYCANGLAGNNHIFTLTGTGSNPSIAIASFSGSSASPFDLENGNGAAGASLSTGTITPSVNNNLIITGLNSLSGTNGTINSGFSLLYYAGSVAGKSFGIGLAYLIQSSASSINPTWTDTGALVMAVDIASFKSL